MIQIRSSWHVVLNCIILLLLLVWEYSVPSNEELLK